MNYIAELDLHFVNGVEWNEVLCQSGDFFHLYKAVSSGIVEKVGVSRETQQPFISKLINFLTLCETLICLE